MTKERGGKRNGAGRPEGSRNKRTLTVAEFLNQSKHNPVENLARLAQKAEADGNLRLAIHCYQALLPYYATRPKPIELDEEETRPVYVIKANFPVPGSEWRNKGQATDE